MLLCLTDIQDELVYHWKKEFSNFPEVQIVCGDILNEAENTIVSPANSYGYMDGGIDLHYTNYFGVKPQEEIQKLINLRPEGHLPVGAAVIVKTGNKNIPYMISAPTMVGPEPVNPSNAFFAMSAILQIASKNNKIIKKVYCPGLATGVGKVPFEEAAIESGKLNKKMPNNHIKSFTSFTGTSAATQLRPLM